MPAVILTPPVSAARPLPAARRAQRARRILMVAPTSFFADYGCHVRILEEARVLGRLGQRVTVVTYYNGHDPVGLDVRRTAPIPWRRDYEVGSSRHKVAFDGLLTWSTLWTALRLKPDVVHGHLHEGALIGGTVARLLRRPVVFDYQGSLSAEMIDHGFLGQDGPLHGPVRRLEGLIDRHVDAIVVSSGRAAGQILGEFKVDPRRLFALPDCVDGATFRPEVLTPEQRAAQRVALGVPPDRPVVVYLGLLAQHQGTDLLLDAAQQVLAERPDTHFLVMGFPAPHVYQVRAAAMGLADQMTFTGRVPYAEAPYRLALGDLAVAPKISATEGNGKLLNYMAMALPTVAFDNAVSREYLADDGVYAAHGEAAALAAGILTLLADPAAGRARGARLRQRALSLYDWERAGARLLALYDRLVLARRLEAPA
jgi:glycosyltransferase involved in cell wall biosynthesis